MEKFPKFIIENNQLILAKVMYHHELVTDKAKVQGGGWFRYLEDQNLFVFGGESHDFGRAEFEDIKQCVSTGNVFFDKRYM